MTWRFLSGTDQDILLDALIATNVIDLNQSLPRRGHIANAKLHVKDGSQTLASPDERS